MIFFLFGLIKSIPLTHTLKCQTCLTIYLYAEYLYSQEVTGDEVKEPLGSMCNNLFGAEVKDICDEIIKDKVLTLYDQVVKQGSAVSFCNQTQYCEIREFNKIPSSFAEKATGVWANRNKYIKNFTKSACDTAKTIWNAAKSTFKSDSAEDI